MCALPDIGLIKSDLIYGDLSWQKMYSLLTVADPEFPVGGGGGGGCRVIGGAPASSMGAFWQKQMRK